MGRLSKPSKPIPMAHFLQQGHTSWTFPNTTTNRWLTVQMAKTMGDILIQTMVIINTENIQGTTDNHHPLQRETNFNKQRPLTEANNKLLTNNWIIWQVYYRNRNESVLQLLGLKACTTTNRLDISIFLSHIFLFRCVSSYVCLPVLIYTMTCIRKLRDNHRNQFFSPLWVLGWRSGYLSSTEPSCQSYNISQCSKTRKGFQ